MVVPARRRCPFRKPQRRGGTSSTASPGGSGGYLRGAGHKGFDVRAAAAAAHDGNRSDERDLHVTALSAFYFVKQLCCC